VSYLERAFVTPGQAGGAPDARALSSRLADVFFKIIEFDFARSVVLTLEASDAAKRQELTRVVRNYFTTLERVRVATTSTPPADPNMARYLANSEKYVVGRQMSAIADRFGALSFPRGQYWALTSMVNVMWSGDGQRLSAVRAEIEKRFDDDLTRVGKRPVTEATLALAERLGLPRRQAMVLDELSQRGAQSSDPVQLEAAARYLARALAVWRTIPMLESVNYWMFHRPAPHPSISTLPNLWSVYLKLGRSADAAPLIAEALEISRPFGEAAEVATIRAYGTAAVAGRNEEAIATVVAASRQLGPSAELALTTVLATAGSGFRLKTAEKALALALALPDPHERAVTLEWYARSRERAKLTMLMNPERFGPASLFDALANNPYPAAFEELLESCLASGEAGLVADALGYQADARAYAGDAAGAVITFRRALDLADGASNFERTALIAIRAVRSKLPASARNEFASRAIEAARKANAQLALAEALRVRASMAVPRGAEHLCRGRALQAGHPRARSRAACGSPRGIRHGARTAGPHGQLAPLPPQDPDEPRPLPDAARGLRGGARRLGCGARPGEGNREGLSGQPGFPASCLAGRSCARPYAGRQ
jgi:tetratricopeptide (TPR) repeat protein